MFNLVSKNILFVLVLILGLDLLFAQNQTLLVDVNQVLPPIKLLNGTNCGPHGFRNHNLNFVELYQQLGIKAIRTHDFYGPCDWMTIFPNWNANPDSSLSYNFSSTDSVINLIVQNGFKVLFRLGSSWRGNRPEYTNDPPGTIRDNNGNIIHQADTNDFKKFAEICKHIVMHYNDGWANGYHYQITDWEIWNEPSLASQFWSGTQLQFQQMFSIVSKTLKAYNPNLRVGGPAQEGQVSPQYEIDFISYCDSNQVPLDFYSYHSYGGLISQLSPYHIAKRTVDVRNLLNLHRYNNTRLVCDEWNSGINEINFSNTGKGAAFYASALSYMVQYNVDASYQYRGDDHPLGLFFQTGAMKIAGESYKAWNLLSALPIRINCEGSDTLGFTIIATRDSACNIIRVLLSNYQPLSKNLSIKLIGSYFSDGTKWSYIRKTIDNTKRFLTVDSSFIFSNFDSLVVYLTISGESVEYFEFKKQTNTKVKIDEVNHDYSFYLSQNWPNPFNTSTKISFSISKKEFVSLKVYNSLGEEILILLQDEVYPGVYEFDLNAESLSSGVYFFQLQTERYTQVKKIILIR